MLTHFGEMNVVIYKHEIECICDFHSNLSCFYELSSLIGRW